jgi:hypothetical protein
MSEYIKHVIDEKPTEFKASIITGLKERIIAVIDDRKKIIGQQIFSNKKN